MEEKDKERKPKEVVALDAILQEVISDQVIDPRCRLLSALEPLRRARAATAGSAFDLATYISAARAQAREVASATAAAPALVAGDEHVAAAVIPLDIAPPAAQHREGDKSKCVIVVTNPMLYFPPPQNVTFWNTLFEVPS
jgi:hypothetical protein